MPKMILWNILFMALVSNVKAGPVCGDEMSVDRKVETLAATFITSQCSIDRMEEFNLLNPNQRNLETKRLTTRCGTFWTVKTGVGEMKVPAGLRVIKIGDEIIFHLNGELYQGKVDPAAFNGHDKCSQKVERPSLEAFYEESLFQLSLAKKLNPDSNPFFNKSNDALIENLKRRVIDQNELMRLEKKWHQKLTIGKLDKTVQINLLQSMITSVYDPESSHDKKTSETTLIVPLSQEWFESDPELKAFFNNTWIHSHYDVRIMAGESGEGVSYDAGKSDETNSSFLQMKSLMKKTNEFIQNEAKNKKLKNHPEAQWLSNVFKSDLTQFERMIFFSPNTWKNDPQIVSWADYVPVDQDLGGFESSYLLSVMIHEINVNTPHFLMTDTHAPKNETMFLRNCVMTNGLEQLKKDPKTIERLFGYNSQIASIYVKMILDE
jgi:hypothetical protein